MIDNDKLKEIGRHFDNLGHNAQVIGENDTFKFHCTQCGRCCMNRTDIQLNPFDIYNAAKYLGISCREFIMENCTITFGQYSKIPMVLLKPKENGYCPFLKLDVKDGCKFKCTINPAKPGVCSNHPIGVAITIDSTTGDMRKDETSYIKVEQCANSKSNEEHVVKDWVKPYTDNIDDINLAHKIQTLPTVFDCRSFYLLCRFIAEPYLNHPEKLVREDNEEQDKSFFELFIELSKQYFISTCSLGYSNYDINKPFKEQAEHVIEELTALYKSLDTVYRHVEDKFIKYGVLEDEDGNKYSSLKDFLNDMFPDESEYPTLNDNKEEEEHE